MNLLERNLAALSEHAPLAAAAARATSSAGGMVVERARSGEPTARLMMNGAAGPYLHSRFDPRTEGRRRAEEIAPASGYIVLWGPGLFYEVEALLALREACRVVIVEPRDEMLRVAMEARDLRGVFSDGRIDLITGENAAPGAVARTVSETYLPVLHGYLHAETTRPRAAESGPTLEAVAAAARAQLSDLAVQRRFGRRWFAHAIRNLATLPGGTVELPFATPVVVAAAGPSLEVEVGQLSGTELIIATDTAAPVLLQRGIHPSLIVALDCQQISYHHLLAAPPTLRRLPIAADLSVAPSLLRHTGSTALVLTAHPLARLLSHRFPELPVVDAGGGNVTQAALSLAIGLGAQTVHVLGADLAYPRGAPYARDSYLFPHFRSTGHRCAPAHGRLWDMVLADPDTVSRATEHGRTYYPPKLTEYRARLEQMIAGLEAHVVFGPPGGSHPKTGHPAAGHPRSAAAAHERRRLTVPPAADRRAWLSEYRRRLAASVPQPGRLEPRVLSTEDRAMLYTLLPAAASFLEGEPSAARAAEAMARARAWSLQELTRVLSAQAANPTPP